MNIVGRWGILFILWPWCSYAILPLPYPTESTEDEGSPGQVQVQDPKSIPGYAELFDQSQLREKELPSFENQPGALGYTAETFNVPEGLKTRVDFWKKIYSEYTSDQAVLHDSEIPDLVYGVIDLTQAVPDPTVSHRKKMRATNRLMKKEKEKLSRQLALLHEKHRNPVDIPVELFPLFRKFERFSEADKFKTAKKRLRAQVGQRDKIVQGFLYGGRYFNQMMTIFEQQQIPKEITRLPLVESAFNLAARSKVGASGVWQFMRSTGKRFLRIDKALDERNDPITATWAAAGLLKQNYESLGSWPLAITAYNHGREGMERAVRVLGTTDLPQIIQRYEGQHFGFASSNFYSEFLAILELERGYRQVFGKLMVDSPLQYEEFSVATSVKLNEIASVCRLKTSELAALNPALSEWVVSNRGAIPAGYRLKVPPGQKETCASGSRNVSWRANRFAEAVF